MGGSKVKLMIGLAACAVLASAPAPATIYDLQWTGDVYLVEGDAPGSDIQVGDHIAGSFVYDDSQLGSPTLLPLGGGVYSIYSAPLAQFAIVIGSYAASAAQIGGTLTYMDDSFGRDGIVLTTEGLAGGPFGSTFASIQLQARGPTTAIDGAGSANGLPYDRLETSFFAIFSDGSSAKRVFGTLRLAEPNVIPEPATWALIVSGFGAVGYAMRRRSTLTVTCA